MLDHVTCVLMCINLCSYDLSCYITCGSQVKELSWAAGF